MPEIRVQDEQGNIHVFPDGSTPEMMAQALGVKPPTPINEPTASISAAPTGAKAWLNSAENDIRYGGQQTMLGKILHAVGAPGINRGVSEDVANQVAGPLIGPIQAAQGVSNMGKHPVSGALQAGAGVLNALSPALAFSGPQAAEAASSIPGKVAEAGEGLQDANNFFARLLRNPATPAQSQAGQAGNVKNILPPFLQKYTIPEGIIPKGDLGTATNPGPYAKIPVRVPKGIPMPGEEAAAAEDAARTFPKPLRPLVGSPEDWQVYEGQMARLKQEASDAGTYSAARGKVGKKLDYQQRVNKKFFGQ